MSIPQHDWLHLAKGLPVGGQGRFPHKGDRTNRPNLVVYNSADRWSCYCQSCKQGGVVFKTHVRVTGVPPPKASTDPTLPLDMVSVYNLPLPVQNAVVGFLISKNMDLLYFDQDIFYSESRKRILIPTPQGWLGRDTTENSPQKWLTYNRSQYLGELREGCTAVLVEDAFSYFKIKWSIKHDERFRYTDVLCTLGTAIRDVLFTKLIRGSTACVVFYDGDKAGERGAKLCAARLTAFGIRTKAATAPSGYDPKDLTCEAIRTHILTHLNGGELGC